MVKHRESIGCIYPFVMGKPPEYLKQKYGLNRVVRLSLNESPYGASPLVYNALKQMSEKISLYPDGNCTYLRSALSEMLNVKEKEIVFGAGADELITLIAMAFVEEGEEVITARVTFSQYSTCAKAVGGIPVLVDMKNYGYDLDAIADAVTEKTKLIYIANPNNPTGTMFNDEEKIAFIKKIPENVLVVFDEAYEEYVIGDFTSSVPLIKQYDNLIVLKTFSKIHGLASLRIGYGIMSEHLSKCLEKVRKSFNITTPSQIAALAALKDDSHVLDVCRKNNDAKEYSYEKLDKMGLSYVKSSANFIMLEPVIKCLDCYDELIKRGYIVSPIMAFNNIGFLRVSLGTVSDMEGFFNALGSIVPRGTDL